MRRLTTETKQFFKTSEFWVYSAILLGILIAGLVIEREEGGPDIFAADKVWLYATILTAAYLLSRGLAKSGVRDPYWDDPNARRGTDGAPIGERVKAAATALTEGPDAVGSGQHQQQQTRPLQNQPPPPGDHTGAGV